MFGLFSILWRTQNLLKGKNAFAMWSKCPFLFLKPRRKWKREGLGPRALVNPIANVNASAEKGVNGLCGGTSFWILFGIS